jgi:hypothetical protein
LLPESIQWDGKLNSDGSSCALRLRCNDPQRMDELLEAFNILLAQEKQRLSAA